MKTGYNELMGRASRFCEHCGVSLGLMTRDKYVAQYINNGGLCRICGKPAIRKEEEDAWLNLAEAQAKYGINQEALGKLIKHGKIRWRPGSYQHGYRGRQIPEREVQRCMSTSG